MVGNVHVERPLVGHRPDDAELVAQIVPEPPVAPVLFDLALKVGWRLGCDVTGVNVEPLQHGLARPGELLHGVHDDRLIRHAQVRQ